MPQVTYRGSVEELVGSSWDVPSTVLNAGQAASWIESQARQAAAEEAAQAEAEQRQRELLAARLEAQRQAAQAEAAEPAPTRSELEAGLRQELSDLSQSVMAAGGAIVGKAELIDQQTRNWESRHEALVATSEATISEAQAQVQAAQAVTQASSEQVQSELADHRLAARDLENELRETVSTLVGPQGEQGQRGLAGSGVAYVDDNPTRIEITSLGERFYGRPVVPGDLAFWRTPDSLQVFRSADGRAWQQIDEIVNRQELVSQPLSILDKSTQVYANTVQTITGAGSGGGGGERLLARSASYNLPVTIADSSNWTTTTQDPTSGNLLLEVTAVDGAFAGKKGFASIAFNYSAGVSESVEYALLGELANLFKFDLTVGRSPAAVPSGITATPPPGATRTTLTLQILPDGGGGTGGVTQFLLSGVVIWVVSALGKADSLTAATEQPGWVWQ